MRDHEYDPLPNGKNKKKPSCGSEEKRSGFRVIETITRTNIRWTLVLYDLLFFILVDVLLLLVYAGDIQPKLEPSSVVAQFLLGVLCIFAGRFIADVYRQIWRYGGIKPYVRLVLADACGGLLYLILERLLPMGQITFIRILAIVCVDLIGIMSMRMIYHYVYLYLSRPEAKKLPLQGFVRSALRLLTGVKIDADEEIALNAEKIRIAIVGAGRVGVALAEELLNNPHAAYQPRCFIDIDGEKIGRQIYGIPVVNEKEADHATLRRMGVQEVVFAMPHLGTERRQELYSYYKKIGCRIKVYDFPMMQSVAPGKRYMREFDVEELLFRKPITVMDEQTSAYYRGKTVLITGGGGSIGSELCRQIAKMEPKRIVLLDIYENGVYDVQQELRIAYGKTLDLCVEILSVCDRAGLERVLATYRPDVVLHAAAHKHVPLMEHNCCEAVKNNVFGTLNAVLLSEKYGVGRFIMVSTDKAVNPTNVMGATKRMCEMIVQSRSSAYSGTVFSATRFGNVLGSAGSVIPLFKRQLMNGGPLTVTDRRIIRYFMTIPEASQLVLQSGRMAKNGELFVLDMGKPVKILDLAENIIRLSGFEPYKDIDIVETGLRPGEKLYEELLVRTEELDKTANSLIFIERDTPLTQEELTQKLELLRAAVAEGSDEAVRQALHRAVPTFRTPEEVNRAAR